MIETFGLTKYFEDFVAVDDVTLTVQPGEVLALLGPNGAGKTTTVRMLTSILRPTRGTARVAGHDVVTEAVAVRANVGVLTEHPGLYMRMNGQEYLEFFARLYQIPQDGQLASITRLAERFGLDDAIDRRLSEYSKGMRQKLALVRALLHDPPILLLDEPTSAMDPHSAKLVRDSIADLRGDGRTIILCTHNLSEAEHLADRIAIIRRGRIIASGTVVELKARLLGPPLMEVRLAAEANGLMQGLAALVEMDSHGLNWARYRAPEPRAINPQVLRWLTSQGAEVITLSEVPQSLEEVYLRVVEE
jgi:ABC-2 type transport system ATP-binding protein